MLSERHRKWHRHRRRTRHRSCCCSPRRLFGSEYQRRSSVLPGRTRWCPRAAGGWVGGRARDMVGKECVQACSAFRHCCQQQQSQQTARLSLHTSTDTGHAPLAQQPAAGRAQPHLVLHHIVESVSLCEVGQRLGLLSLHCHQARLELRSLSARLPCVLWEQGGGDDGRWVGLPDQRRACVEWAANSAAALPLAGTPTPRPRQLPQRCSSGPYARCSAAQRSAAHLMRRRQLHARPAQVLPLGHKLRLHFVCPAQQAVLAGDRFARVSHNLRAGVATPTVLVGDGSTGQRAVMCRRVWGGDEGETGRPGRSPTCTWCTCSSVNLAVQQ